MKYADHKGKITAGIIGGIGIGIGITAVVLTGGLAAIGFLAVAAVASLGMMYAGADSDLKKSMGGEKYAEKYGYGSTGTAKRMLSGLKNLFRPGKSHDKKLETTYSSTTTPETTPLNSTDHGTNAPKSPSSNQDLPTKQPIHQRKEFESLVKELNKMNTERVESHRSEAKNGPLYNPMQSSHKIKERIEKEPEQTSPKQESKKSFKP